MKAPQGTPHQQLAPVVKEQEAFPGSLNIMGKHWPFEWVENSSDFSDGNDANGETVYSRQTIRIKDGTHFDCERDTVIHETLHALDHELQLGLKEKQVHRLATGLYQIFRSNPDLYAYIMAPHPEEQTA